MESRQRRIALNEAQFREINEALRDSLESAGVSQQTISFVCECGNTGCREGVEVGWAAYEAVRSNPRRFFVVGGHDMPEAEDVVQRCDTYWVVEKKEEAAAIAEASDPRD